MALTADHAAELEIERPSAEGRFDQNQPFRAGHGTNSTADTNEGLPSPQGGLIDPCAGAVCFRVPNVISAIATQEIVLRIL